MMTLSLYNTFIHECKIFFITTNYIFLNRPKVTQTSSSPVAQCEITQPCQTGSITKFYQVAAMYANTVPTPPPHSSKNCVRQLYIAQTLSLEGRQKRAMSR